MDDSTSDIHITVSCDNTRTVALAENSTPNDTNIDSDNLDDCESTIATDDNAASAGNTDNGKKFEDTCINTTIVTHDTNSCNAASAGNTDIGKKSEDTCINTTIVTHDTNSCNAASAGNTDIGKKSEDTCINTTIVTHDTNSRNAASAGNTDIGKKSEDTCINTATIASPTASNEIEAAKENSADDVKPPLHSTDGKTPLHSTDGKAPLHSTDGKAPLHSTDGELPLHSTDGKVPLHSTDGKPPLHSTDGKVPLQDISKLKYPTDTSEDMFKSALMQKSKNISSADKAKIASMVKGLSKYKDAEEDLQVMFTSTGNTKKPRKKGTGLDCEIEESIQSLKAYAPLDPDSNKTDTEPVIKQGKPNEEAVGTNAAPVAIAKANTAPRQTKDLGVSGTPSGADSQSPASIDQFDLSTNTNLLFEFSTTDIQSPTPSGKKKKKQAQKKSSVADTLQEIADQAKPASGKGKGKAAKQSTEHRTVNLDFLENLSDDQLPAPNLLGYSAMMGEQGQGKKKKKGKRQQESSAASGSYSQLLQSMGGASQMGGAKLKSNPTRPAPLANQQGSKAKPTQAEQLKESLKASPRHTPTKVMHPTEPVVKQKGGGKVKQPLPSDGGKKKNKEKKKKDMPMQQIQPPQLPSPFSQQEARLNVRKPPPLVIPFSQPLSTQEVRLNVRKDQHTYIAGPQKLHLQEIFNITGVVIEVPSAESYSEEIVLRGNQQQVGAALALMFSKSQLAQAQEAARPREMSQPSFVQGQGSHTSQGHGNLQQHRSVDEDLADLKINENANRPGAYGRGQEYKRTDRYVEYRHERGQTLEQGQGHKAQGHQSHSQQFHKGAMAGHDKQQQQRSIKGQSHVGDTEGQQRTEGQGQGSTPKSQGKKLRQRKKDCRKPVFEEYLALDEVSHGLKRGSLIQGPIRINPKNFMEAYVPHPDRASDVLILSIGNRNRALNGDIVAVFIEDQAEWKLNKEQLQILEEEQSLIAAGGLSENTIGEVKVTDSDAEVVIESEEIVELVGNLSNDGTKSVEENSDIAKCNTVKEESNIAKSESVEKNSDITKSESVEVNSDIAGKAGDITFRLSDLSIEPIKPAEKADVQSNKNESKDVTKMKKPETPNTDKKAKQSPYKRPDRFTSLREVMADGSPVAKRLFDNQGNSEAGSHSEEGKKLLQRTGKVVAILEQKHSRASAGHIKPFQDKNPNSALFMPNDHRMPRMMVPIDDCPKDFLERPEDHEKTLFIARLTEWKIDSQFAFGRLARSLGEAGEIEPETEAHLIENGVDFDEFPQEAIDCLPKDLPWTIPASEIEKRRDFRDACVFTIDPATARDLDDALSCESLGDGKYKVGVHIADVSYFLDENTILDKVAAQRATSVYLVHKVIPMLPRLLCEQLCSLNPDEDRLSFSVEWTINEDGEIEEEWFGRTVIRSCVKFSYDHAQGFLDQPDRDWTQEELPPISAPFTVDDIKSRVLALNKIATSLRHGRFEGGALRLDQVKLQFTLDKETGLPNGYWVYHQKDSNRLIEEFMLLANMAVAHRINTHYPDKALLRRHPPPQEKMVENLKEFCSSLGIHIDISTAGGINRSLQRYCGDDEFSPGRMQVLVSLCSKPMQNAKYFCNGCIDDESLYRHYALNVPLYTHFTSPIRRYADVLVHRVLAASLDYCEDSARSPQEIHRQAEHCNDKKTAAKRVGDLSSELFFGVFVKTAGQFEETAMVMSVMDKAFDIFVLKLGVSKRVYCDKLPLKEKVFKRERKVPSLTLTWAADDDKPEVQQKISIFSIVDCVLQPGELPLQWTAVIKRPQPPMMAKVVPSEDE